MRRLGISVWLCLGSLLGFAETARAQDVDVPPIETVDQIDALRSAPANSQVPMAPVRTAQPDQPARAAPKHQAGNPTPWGYYVDTDVGETLEESDLWQAAREAGRSRPGQSTTRRRALVRRRDESRAGVHRGGFASQVAVWTSRALDQFRRAFLRGWMAMHTALGSSSPAG